MGLMDINEVIEVLKGRGHYFGSAALSQEGYVLLSIDGRLMTYDEARELLANELETEEQSSLPLRTRN